MNPLSWWTKEFGDFAPVGHVLRAQLHSRWLRVHSLTNSKRYPENKQDYEELLHRNLEIANNLFQLDETIFVFDSCFFYDDSVIEREEKLMEMPLSNQFLVFPSSSTLKNYDDDDRFIVWYFNTKWKPTFFELLIQKISVDQLRMITFVSYESKNIFAPYDGGMDIFLFNESLNEMRLKYSSWLSARNDGL